MKTSNKLLIGLFAFIVLGMIIGNAALKKNIKNALPINQQIEMKMQENPSITDSVATDQSFNND